MLCAPTDDTGEAVVEIDTDGERRASLKELTLVPPVACATAAKLVKADAGRGLLDEVTARERLPERNGPVACVELEVGT